MYIYIYTYIYIYIYIYIYVIFTEDRHIKAHNSTLVFNVVLQKNTKNEFNKINTNVAI